MISNLGFRTVPNHNQTRGCNKDASDLWYLNTFTYQVPVLFLFFVHDALLFLKNLFSNYSWHVVLY